MLTTTQIAAELGVTVRCVEKWIASGQLKAQKMGRDWLVARRDLARMVRVPIGRPRKSSE